MAHQECNSHVRYTYTILLNPHEDGGFVVTCPALPDLIAHGDTLADARERAAAAIECYLERRSAQGGTIPVGEGEQKPGAPRTHHGALLPRPLTPLPKRGVA